MKAAAHQTGHQTTEHPKMTESVILYWHKDTDPTCSIQNITTVTEWPEGKTANEAASQELEVQAKWYPRGLARGHSGVYYARVLGISSKFP